MAESLAECRMFLAVGDEIIDPIIGAILLKSLLKKLPRPLPCCIRLRTYIIEHDNIFVYTKEV